VGVDGQGNGQRRRVGNACAIRPAFFELTRAQNRVVGADHPQLHAPSSFGTRDATFDVAQRWLGERSATQAGLDGRRQLFGVRTSFGPHPAHPG
jgi:hypothetical protein